MTISLGTHDPDVTSSVLEGFLTEVQRISGTRTNKLLSDKGLVPIRPGTGGIALNVSKIQQALKRAGFFPGGNVDGIVGYRTRSAIRLFQEYVRSVEGRPCTPDGIVGPKTASELARWADQGLEANWLPRLKLWESGALKEESSEYNRWFAFLAKWEAKCAADPSPMLRMAEAYRGDTDTLKMSAWTFSNRDVHLVGIRNGEREQSRKFDDVLVLLIKGQVFKFQGSTDPGHTKNPKGAPFLVEGQHDFHFGLHQGRYHALRPLHYGSHGVLVVRSKGDLALTEEDLASGLEPNGTINIHWAGKGIGRPVNRWSEGCQVITGSGYQNHEGSVIDCSGYVGRNNKEVSAAGKNKTRGAYNVMADLIIAFSSDNPNPGLVKYNLLHDADLGLDASIAEVATRSRTAAREFIKALS